ncbi:MAG: hypothetical protein C3F17_01715 [Bradyrhizobiaceae bacterium]|nr:MAG: hypothetical protein C3F17_01715 [Bradyrhizobiaceae bacterium]
MDEPRELSIDEIEIVSGGEKARITLGPVSLFAGDGVAGISVRGLGSVWIESDGTVCGSSGGKMGCIPQ